MEINLQHLWFFLSKRRWTQKWSMRIRTKCTTSRTEAPDRWRTDRMAVLSLSQAIFFPNSARYRSPAITFSLFCFIFFFRIFSSSKNINFTNVQYTIPVRRRKRSIELRYTSCVSKSWETMSFISDEARFLLYL